MLHLQGHTLQSISEKISQDYQSTSIWKVRSLLAKAREILLQNPAILHWHENRDGDKDEDYTKVNMEEIGNVVSRDIVPMHLQELLPKEFEKLPQSIFKDEDIVNLWLTSMYVKDNPFGTNNADEERDNLSSFFVSPSFFYRLLGHPTRPQSVILFAPRGHGKTACRFEVARIAREYTTPPILPIHLVEFDSLAEIVQQQDSPLLLSSYIPLIIRNTLKALTDEVEKDSTHKTRQEKNSAMVARFCALNTLYLEPDQHIFSYPPASTFDMVQYYQQTPLSLHDYLKTLIALVQHIGFACIYILIDGIDETPQTSDNPALALELIRPLLELSGSFEGMGVAFKFFLPDILETLMRQQQIGRLDRIRTYHLKWTDDDLHQMWRLRLSSYSRISETESKGVVLSFYVLCEGEDDVDSLLIKAAQGSPRKLIALGREIVETHCYENNPSERDVIPMATVQAVLER